jgi:putative spermidine/putrescine transport system ATP-binding protein
VMQVDTPRRIYDQPANRFVAEFIGESTFLKVAADGAVCRFAGSPLQVANPPAAAAPALLMLRPERVRVGDGERRDGHNVLDARVTDVIYQGDTYLVQAVLPDGSRISARGIASATALGRAPAVGELAPFGFAAHDAVLIADGAG